MAEAGEGEVTAFIPLSSHLLEVLTAKSWLLDAPVWFCGDKLAWNSQVAQAELELLILPPPPPQCRICVLFEELLPCLPLHVHRLLHAQLLLGPSVMVPTKATW